jgi:hypothetical protein
MVRTTSSSQSAPPGSNPRGAPQSEMISDRLAARLSPAPRTTQPQRDQRFIAYRDVFPAGRQKATGWGVVPLPTPARPAATTVIRAARAAKAPLTACTPHAHTTHRIGSPEKGRKAALAGKAPLAPKAAPAACTPDAHTTHRIDSPAKGRPGYCKPQGPRGRRETGTWSTSAPPRVGGEGHACCVVHQAHGRSDGLASASARRSPPYDVSVCPRRAVGNRHATSSAARPCLHGKRYVPSCPPFGQFDKRRGARRFEAARRRAVVLIEDGRGRQRSSRNRSGGSTAGTVQRLPAM